MSDISIPGINSRFNTEELVSNLVEVERVAVTRLERQIESYETEKSQWLNQNRVASQLRDAARLLFSFDSPFQERKVEVSEEGILNATANRNALEGTLSLEVVRLASGDRFRSSNLSDDYRVPEGQYEFSVGDRTINLRYRGGSLRDFSERLNRSGEGYLRSNVIQTSSDTQVFLIESLVDGSDGTLGFEGAAREFGIEAGILGQAESSTVDFPEAPGVLVPNENQRFALPRSLDPSIDWTVEIVGRLQVNPEYQYSEPETPPGPDSVGGGTLNFRGIDVPLTGPGIDLPSFEPEPPPPVVNDERVLYGTLGGRRIPLVDFASSGENSSYRLRLADFGSTDLTDLELVNGNTEKDLIVESLRIIDPNERGDYTPLRPLDLASDALIKLDGIEVTRSSNQIDDLLPGVTLNLQSPSDGEVDITISPDRELVKEKIIDFVATYNQVVREINILTRTDPNIVAEIEFFTDEERTEATERLGLFQGDSTLNTLKSRLQNLSIQAYPVSEDGDIMVLSQIGISTNASSTGGVGGGGLNASRLRGYLEINEDVLEEALNTRFDQVKALFGRDSDGDLIVDQGIGFSAEALLKPYTQVGGIFAARSDGLENRISESQDDIRDEETRIEDYEQELRLQYGRMESAINALESNSQDLSNLSNNNNN